jgi:hypothetical protein
MKVKLPILIEVDVLDRNLDRTIAGFKTTGSSISILCEAAQPCELFEDGVLNPSGTPLDKEARIGITNALCNLLKTSRETGKSFRSLIEQYQIEEIKNV